MPSFSRPSRVTWDCSLRSPPQAGPPPLLVPFATTSSLKLTRRPSTVTVAVAVAEEEEEELLLPSADQVAIYLFTATTMIHSSSCKVWV